LVRLLIVSPIQAVRVGLRAMLSGYPAHPAPPALDDVQIEELSSLDQADAYLDEIDILIVAAESPSRNQLSQLTSRQAGHLSVLLLTGDAEINSSGGGTSSAGRDSSPERRLSALLITLSRLPLRSWGVLPAGCTAEELGASIQALAEGLIVGAPLLLGPAFQPSVANPANGISSPDGQIETPTERETEVLQLLAQGLANKQIAARLSISEHTVKFHVSSIYSKLGAANRTEAVRTGLQHGLITL
jgi:DNA-binding CsgD family transcriptional regulator